MGKYTIETDTLQIVGEDFETAIQLATKLSKEGSVYIMQNEAVLRIFRNGNEVFRKEGT